MSAQLLAGLDGICNQIDPSSAGFGPFDSDVFSWSTEQRARIRALPTSLEEALSALEQDYAFLRAGDVFSEDLIKRWIAYKRKYELEEVQSRPHPYEIQLYYNV
jgi:glutamine synthetase